MNSLQISSQEIGRPSEFTDGLVAINRSLPDSMALPVQVFLVSSDVSDKPQLDALYPMTSISDYALNALRPSGLNPDIFSSACFRDSLASIPQQLQLLALQGRADARKIGRLARTLAKQDELFRLAQMYASALVQG
jgi:hypothetical protein